MSEIVPLEGNTKIKCAEMSSPGPLRDFALSIGPSMCFEANRLYKSK
jgi:hypothetical protein